MFVPHLADYTQQEQSCAERSKNLQLGQTVAPGCEQYDPHRRGRHEENRLVGLMPFVDLGVSYVSPRDAVPSQIGVIGAIGAAYAQPWWEIGLYGRAAAHPSPRDERTYSTTAALHVALRLPLNEDLLLRVGIGPGFGPWWTGGRGAVSHADLDAFVHLAVRSAPDQRMRVGPMIRAAHTWALPYREDAWILTAEVGITL